MDDRRFQVIVRDKAQRVRWAKPVRGEFVNDLVAEAHEQFAGHEVIIIEEPSLM